MPRNNNNDRINEFIRNNYTRCNLILKGKDADILNEFSSNLNISKNALLQKCLVYCYENMIDVSRVKLSTTNNKK